MLSNFKVKNINVMSNWDVQIQNSVCYSEDKGHVFLEIEDLSLLEYDGCYLYVNAWCYERSCHCHRECVAVPAEQPLQQNIGCFSCIAYRWGRRQQDCWCCHSVTLHYTLAALLWGPQTFLWNVHMYVPNKTVSTLQNTVVVLILTTYWNSDHNIFLNQQL